MQELLSSLGGFSLGTVVGAIIGWLGKVLSDRLSNRHRLMLELRRNDITRTSDATFKAYQTLWISLQKVKMEGIRLWDEVTPDTVSAFGDAVRNAALELDNGQFLISHHHHAALRELIETFGTFQMGKHHLIEIQSPEQLISDYELDQHFSLDQRISAQVDENREKKLQYEAALRNLAIELRKQFDVDG